MNLLTTLLLKDAVEKAFSENPKAKGGLLLRMVPQIMRTWAAQPDSPLHPPAAIDPAKSIPWNPRKFLQKESQ